MAAADDRAVSSAGGAEADMSDKPIVDTRFPAELYVKVSGGSALKMFTADDAIPTTVDDGDNVGVYRLVEVRKVRVTRELE
jgi:hypothetical protein